MLRPVNEHVFHEAGIPRRLRQTDWRARSLVQSFLGLPSKRKHTILSIAHRRPQSRMLLMDAFHAEMVLRRHFHIYRTSHPHFGQDHLRMMPCCLVGVKYVRWLNDGIMTLARARWCWLYVIREWGPDSRIQKGNTSCENIVTFAAGAAFVIFRSFSFK